MVQKIPIVVRMFVISLVLTLLFVGTAMGEVSRDGLVAEWHFDDDAKDSSGNGNDGVIHGAAFVDGISGKALSFDGSNDEVDFGSGTTLNLPNALTIEAWIYPQASTIGGIVMKGKYQNEYDASYSTIYGSDNKISFLVWNTPHTRLELISNNALTLNQWHHIVYTWDGSTTAARIYINGNLDNEIANTGINLAMSTNEPLRIGRFKNIDYGEKWFKGIIDEVRIYNRALTADEVISHYEGKQSSLSLTKTTSPQSIKQGQTSTVTVSVENTGTTDINDIEIADTMPSDVYFVSGEISKKYTTLRPKDVREFQYVVKINDVGTFNLYPAQATYADDEGNYYSTESNTPSIKTIASLDSSSNQETSISFDIEKPNEKSIPGFEIIELIIPVIFLIFLRSKKL